ncbi:alpha/beta fold hydrolase [Nocardia sp. NPDC127606]|uniref:alpha/beta fold hydrolase n=1 Tax=Nocardia sp. NPDC127606 TaxID=3345406 RepID=UPI00362C3DFA
MHATDVSIALGDVTLRGTVTGAGPTVLLLHAGGEQRGVWAPVASQLAAAGLRTAAFDLRGHGESTGEATVLRAVAEDVVEMVRREPAPLVVVGASVGGLAAIAALGEPDIARRVAGLILVDVVPHSDPDRVRAWLSESGLRDQRTELVEDSLAAGSALHATAVGSEVPMLLVRGGQSPLTDPEVDRFLADRRVTVTRVADAGHLIAREAPDELARIVSEHANTWLATAQVVQGAFDLQRVLGAEEVEHPGGTLHAHLRRVHNLLAEWNATPRTRLAAICHASYGTDGFAVELLPTTDRPRLVKVIGPAAEDLVYLYGGCDRERTYRDLGREPLAVIDRFTGTSRLVQGADLHAFAVLTIANELDVARHARLPPSALTGIRSLVLALASYAPEEAARALADEALA